MPDQTDEKLAKEWLDSVTKCECSESELIADGYCSGFCDIKSLAALLQRVREKERAEWVRAVREFKRKATLSVAMSRPHRAGRLDACDEILRRMGVKEGFGSKAALRTGPFQGGGFYADCDIADKHGTTEWEAIENLVTYLVEENERLRHGVKDAD